MDKSDLEIYQNIVVSGENDPTEITLSSNNTTLNNYLQVCQICGVVLKLDNNINNISDNAYRQLSHPYSIKDDIENGLLRNVDADMEISLSALVSDMSNHLGMYSQRRSSNMTVYHKTNLYPILQNDRTTRTILTFHLNSNHLFQIYNVLLQWRHVAFISVQP